MDNVEKILNLYKYIKELCALRYKIVTDINEQYWTCFLKDIPNDSDNITVYYRDHVEEESSDNRVLLEVKKPEFQKCPEPPAIISDRLEPGWEKFTNTPALKNSLAGLNEASGDDKLLQQNIEHFEDSTERIQAYERWIISRDKWAEKQRVISETRDFFNRLYHAYIDLERESETLEFMVGNGLISDIKKQAVNHPVLLKRVRFDFDSKKILLEFATRIQIRSFIPYYFRRCQKLTMVLLNN